MIQITMLILLVIIGFLAEFDDLPLSEYLKKVLLKMALITEVIIMGVAFLLVISGSHFGEQVIWFMALLLAGAIACLTIVKMMPTLLGSNLYTDERNAEMKHQMHVMILCTVAPLFGLAILTLSAKTAYQLLF